MTINNSQPECREGNVTGAMAVQLWESGLGRATSECVSATATENSRCTLGHPGSHEVPNGTQQMHLFSQSKEFANVHIRG